MRPVQKILIHQKTGKRFVVKDLQEDFHTPQGSISHKDLASEKEILISTKGDRFLALRPNFPDLWEELQRGPQIMIHKDIGLIIAKTGLHRESIIVDAGGGSGSLCLSLAHIAKHVTTYETSAENVSIITKNQQMMAINNLTVKHQNIYDGIDESNVDIITLDLPEPWHVLLQAEKALTPGGFLVVYLPNLTQMQEFILQAVKTRCKVIETIELIERKWVIDQKIMRPEFQMLGHTGFLTFCRKL